MIKVVLCQRLRCAYNNSSVLASRVVELPSPPYYGLTIESNLEKSMLSRMTLDPSQCEIIYNTTKDFYRVQHSDFSIETEKEMLDLIDRYRFHGWNIEIAGAKEATVNEKSGYHKKVKKHPFTVIDGGKTD